MDASSSPRLAQTSAEGRPRLRRWDTVILGLSTVVVFMLLLGAARLEGVSIEAAVADPEEATDLRFLGIISNVGVFLWVAITSICLLAARSTVNSDRALSMFFRVSAIVTAVLLLDDFLLIHEHSNDVVGFFVDFDHSRRNKNVLELAVFTLYGALVASYLLRYRSVIVATRHLPLRLAGLFLAGSLAIDMGGLDTVAGAVGRTVSGETEAMLEEAAKLLAIVYLAYYFFNTASSVLSQPADAGRRR